MRRRFASGQESREGHQPLDAFADEVIDLLTRNPREPEILVERVGLLRFAEAQGRLPQTLEQLNPSA